MAFGLDLLFNDTGPKQYDANYHKVFVHCVVSGSGSYVIINKMWVDSFNPYLYEQNSEIEPSKGLPLFRFFPFFFSSRYILVGGEELEFNSQYPDSFNTPYYPMVQQGFIIQPLSNWSAQINDNIYTGFNTPGFNVSYRRDNYRLPKRIKLFDHSTTGDKLKFNLMFSTDLRGEHTGFLNIEYIVYSAGTGQFQNKSRAIPLNGVIHRSNFSEVDYTDFEDIYELEGANVSSPFVAVELS